MPSFYSENNTPRIDDGDTKILQKVLGTLQDGVSVTGVTLNGDVSVGKLTIDQSTPGTTNGVVVNSSALPTGAATQATLDSVLAKIIAAPATEAKQDSTLTALASILSKLIAAPATEAKQDTGNSTLSTLNGKVTACNTGAVAVASSALPSGASTEATLAALNAKITAMNSGAVVVASGAVTNTPVAQSLAYSAGAYEASRIAKAAAGTLYTLTGYNSGPAQFIQIHDSATLPANGAAPVVIIPVPAQGGFSYDFAGYGLPLSNGIVITNSSTGPTKTIGSADCYFTLLYK